jgi:UDP-galactopyranose mutase
MYNQLDLLCLSHLRWEFVFQRPQHLMSRFARHRRVFFIEEPVFDGDTPHLQYTKCHESGVQIVTPRLPRALAGNAIAIQQRLLRKFLETYEIDEYIAWYYTPMALELTDGILRPRLVVYDCMDELSAFAGAPAAMQKNESRLFGNAGLVFTGGASLYEAKRKQHPSVYLFPSSVDTKHFASARMCHQEPEDQTALAHPRIGYAGVIDERMDLELIRIIAESRPQWHLVMLGPITKIDPRSLPRAENIHYLGLRPYRELPAYMSGWDVAMLPFALNESTRFISPTKTPEYLAAGLPVVSTPIVDVDQQYGQLGLVRIARDASEFIRLIEDSLRNPPSPQFLSSVDSFLALSSWDRTWDAMNELMRAEFEKRRTFTMPEEDPEPVFLAKAAHV